MNGIIILTHNDIGKDLIKCVKIILKKKLSNIFSVNVLPSDNQNNIALKLRGEIAKLKDCNGIIILTDIYGATPCNTAKKFIDKNLIVVSGLNLNMLLKAITYQDTKLCTLSNKVISGAIQGISIVKKED